MSNQSVVIKSNKYGLIVVLDEKTEWEELKKNVAEKFRTSAKFFGSAQMALCFQGRKLTFEEELELSDTISANCQIQVVCIADENTSTEQAMKQALERNQEESADLMNLQDGRFYKGDVYKRQEYWRTEPAHGRWSRQTPSV